ncbi:manganese efflux pump MntP [Carboxylicivirga linearis]|uniref:Putative manganese efflux pump MntP n=1 Tax=Carboxylicivirga linearis TaxID=1628157 RepID=A0ABS5JRQ5_9BACT|nr:manganese efflux pump MntP family protein [Carboxylicivirga linearis]MBS2097508.1 manganese efflux pump [Carboxylicivirga linearis]
MEFLSLLLLAVALAMDSFAVSITVGLSIKKIKFNPVGKVCLLFAFFQGIMPVIGWALGQSFADAISAYDHWVVFALLLFIGGKMLYEAFQYNESAPFVNAYNNKTITMLAIATSIDALAVGISFSLLNVDIVMPAIVIGIVTFIFSHLGIAIGWKLGSIFRNKMEIIGGILLIGIGIKILIEHLLQ